MSNKIISRLTGEQLILSNVYLGDNLAFVNVKLKPYLYGFKNGFHILNIVFTKIQFNILINNIINLVALRQKILIVKDLDYYNLTLSLNSKNVFYYNKKWIGGVLTNFRVVRKCEKFFDNNKYSNNLSLMRYMPSMVFLFNVNISKWALFEAYNLEIPLSAIINSNSQFFEFVNYPVIGNNQTFESIYLYVNVLKNAFLKGKKKERLRILHIL